VEVIGAMIMIPLNQHPAGGVSRSPQTGAGIDLMVDLILVGSPLTTINEVGLNRVIVKEVGDLHDQQAVVVAGEDPQMMAGAALQTDQDVISENQEVTVVGNMKDS